MRRPASSTGGNSTASGYKANASGENAVATGNNANAAGQNSVAVGSNATVLASAANSVALGAGSVASQPNTVSVGSPGAERRITNVAPGVAGTDAVNVNQLNAVSDLAQRLSKRAYNGIAVSMAMQGNAPYLPGKWTMGVGYGYYGGQNAAAARISYWGDSGKWNINGAVGSGFTKNTFGARAGMDFVF